MHEPKTVSVSIDIIRYGRPYCLIYGVSQLYSCFILALIYSYSQILQYTSVGEIGSQLAS